MKLYLLPLDMQYTEHFQHSFVISPMRQSYHYHQRTLDT